MGWCKKENNGNLLDPIITKGAAVDRQKLNSQTQLVDTSSYIPKCVQ